MSNQEMLDRAENIEVGLSFSGKMSREHVMARLLDAQSRAKEAHRKNGAAHED